MKSFRQKRPGVPFAFACALALALPAASAAAARHGATPPLPPVETVVTPPVQEGPPAGAPAPQAPGASTTPAKETPPAPAVQGQHPQGSSESLPTLAPARAKPGTGAKGTGEETSTSSALRAGQRAPSPSVLTPSLPFDLRSSIAGVPGFFVESFRFPPFLLPIYQAAGSAYGIPWQVLAAINEVETDYGRDLSVSSAGAEGWMQFLPAEWTQYGVDANGDGFQDPYNPADAIFAAARYLRAAGGEHSIRTAVFSYNHSQAYVESVLLRAQLLAGTPPELLGAVTGLTEARFPVYAPAHFSDGFPTVTAAGSSAPHTLVGTTIYSQAGAPVIAVQDGEVAQIGDSRLLGHFVVLRDAFGNTYLYAQLGDVAPLYPVLQPHAHSAVSSRIAQSHAEPAPSGPATAGAQPRSPLSGGATVSGLALGAAAALEAPAGAANPTPAPAPRARARASARFFTEGPNDVYLHPLRAGVQVIAGTVLGHLGRGASGGAPTSGEPHLLFQIRPAGAGAPLIDPKPVLDGWVALENSSIFRAKGENPFLATSPSTGQVLLESKQQLEPQVLHDRGIRLGACGRQAVRSGRVDKRALAALEYLSVSGANPTVSGLACSRSANAAATVNAAATATATALEITAINGIAVAAHQGAGSITDATVRKLLMLQGLARPQRIVTLIGYPGSKVAAASPRAADAIHVYFSKPLRGGAHAAALPKTVLSAGGWSTLIARLGEIPDPTVARAPSAAAIPDPAAPPGASAGSSRGNN
ncbi:MAG: hypothetical protein QOI03_1818 [Solirubrobacteraceae bacterium]|nr:hypothetical protein [Solirubrobacteraceae bacterium]